MIIGLCGYKNCGKDTVAAHLIKTYDFERKAFADSLKRSVSELLGIPFRDIERHKNDESVFVTIGYKGENPSQLGPNHMWSPIRELTFREFLQRYGTEAHREIFGKDFWVDSLLPKQVYTGRKIVVPDVRFHNECDRIKELGGKIIRINRPQASMKIDTHRSEMEFVGFLTDYTLENNSTLSDLDIKIERMMERLVND